jgi:hypothetical protein
MAPRVVSVVGKRTWPAMATSLVSLLAFMPTAEQEWHQQTRGKECLRTCAERIPAKPEGKIERGSDGSTERAGNKENDIDPAHSFHCAPRGAIAAAGRDEPVQSSSSVLQAMAVPSFAVTSRLLELS